MPLSIKMEPELRHALAHMIYAIDALAKGEVEEAKFEIESIRGLVFWDSDEGQTADSKEWARREFGETDIAATVEDELGYASMLRMGDAGYKVVEKESLIEGLEAIRLAWNVYRAMEAARLKSHQPATEEESDGKQHEVR